MVEEEINPQKERAEFGKEKPKAKDTARIIWASKPKKEPTAKDLEFQTAEEVYPNKEDIKDKKLSAFWAETKDISDDPNRLIWGDNLLVMKALLAQGYEGQIDLIYVDPPFNTGENFNFSSEVKIGNTTIQKELPVNERLAYTDTWKRGIDSFLDMLYPRLQLIRKLLSEKGTVYVHCDWHISHYIRVILDEIFGKENFLNEIVWHYFGFKRSTARKFPMKHDVVLSYSKSLNPTWSVQYKPHRPEYLKRFKKDKEGRLYRDDVNPTGGGARTIFLDELKGDIVDSVWNDIPPVNPAARDRTDYPTQKPVELVKRIISASSNKGDLVADFFAGSGTMGAAAEDLERRWILSDLSKTAIQVARSRLVNQNAKPFLIQNLGNYQRQLIYSKEINLKQMYNIILKLYGASPRKDWQGFGISNDDKKTVVFVCEPDRAMTAHKAYQLAQDAKHADGKGYKRLIILSWDYEMNFDNEWNRAAKSKKSISDVEFKIIPSDVYKYLRSTKVGDLELSKKITFYQKPYFKLGEPQIISKDKDESRVKIKIDRYVVLDIPVRDENKRPEIENLLKKNFANLIDYWTIDWDYDGEVFRSNWQALKERKSNKPVRIVAENTMKRGKKYKIAIRVVDVFGNDASAIKEIDLR